MTEAIGEIGGIRYDERDDYRYVVKGYILHHDGCQQIGVFVNPSKNYPATDWADGFGRSPEDVVEMVDRLPLNYEQKLQLLTDGIYPKGLLDHPSLRRLKCRDRSNMFSDVIHLLPKPEDKPEDKTENEEVANTDAEIKEEAEVDIQLTSSNGKPQYILRNVPRNFAGLTNCFFWKVGSKMKFASFYKDDIIEEFNKAISEMVPGERVYPPLEAEICNEDSIWLITRTDPSNNKRVLSHYYKNYGDALLNRKQLSIGDDFLYEIVQVRDTMK